MFGYDPYYVGGAVIGGIIGVFLFSILFRYALLGRSGTKSQQLWVVLLTGIVAIGFYAFGDGTDGFMNRITNRPDMMQVVSYSLSALIVGFFVWWRTEDTPPAPEAPKKMGGIVGRAFALVFVVPMILIGLGNIGGSIYGLAVHGPAPGPGWGVSKAEMRDIMLNGDMAGFWEVVDERAPSEMDYVIDRMFAQEANFDNLEDARAIFNQELANFRVSLSTYGPAMTDDQRKELIQAQIEVLKQLKDRPALCAEVAMTGGQTLSQADLLTVKDVFNNAFVVMTENLLDAKVAATEGAFVPTPPTEEDYGQLFTELVEAGMTEGELQAIINEDTSHPEYCSGTIAFMEGIIDMEGAEGEAVRFETSQAMLVTVP